MASKPTANEQIEAAYRDLNKLRRRLRFGSWVTLIVGLLLLAVVAGYFAYGYSEISALQDPELLVSLVGQTIDQSIPQLRQRLQSEVDNNAKAWAQRASDELVARAPEAREKLEDYICQGTDSLIDQLEVLGEQEFKRVLTENRTTLLQAIKELDDEEEISEGTVLMLEEALEKEMQVSMEEQTQAVLIMLSDVNRNMKMLAEGENLGQVQQCERRALMLARRFQLEWFGDVRIEDLAPKGLTDAVEQLERERLERDRADADAKTAELPKPKAAEPEAKQPEKTEAEKPGQPGEAETSPAADQKAAEAEAPKE